MAAGLKGRVIRPKVRCLECGALLRRSRLSKRIYCSECNCMPEESK